MNLSPTIIVLSVSILMFLSVLVSKTAYRTGLPVLVLFLIIGMLAGSEGVGKISFDSPKMAQFLGIIALCFILYSGGLDTKYQQIKPILWRGITLSDRKSVV